MNAENIRPAMFATDFATNPNPSPAALAVTAGIAGAFAPSPFGRPTLRLSPDGDGSGGDETPEQLKSRLAAVTQESIERRQALKAATENVMKLQKELEELRKSAPTKEELDKLRADAAEAEAKRKAEMSALEKSQEEISKLQKQTAELAAARDAEVASIRRKYHATRIEQVVRANWSAHTSFPIDDLLSAVTAKLAVDDATDAVIVVGPDGKTPERNPSTGKDMTPAEWVAKFVADRPHLAAVKPKGGPGIKPNPERDLSALSQKDAQALSHDAVLELVGKKPR